MIGIHEIYTKRAWLSIRYARHVFPLPFSNSLSAQSENYTHLHTICTKQTH